MPVTGFYKKEGLSFKPSCPTLVWPLLLALLGGGLATLSWPWPGLWPLCFVSLVPLILAINGQSGRRAFFLGWVYGLSLSFTSLPWITDVLAGYGGLGPVIGWIVVALLSVYLALYSAFFAWIITIRLNSPFWWTLVGAAAWCGLDWLKNLGPLGFNWTPLAGPLSLSPEMGQAADLVGFYGLGFFVAWVNFALVVYFYKRRKAQYLSARCYMIGTLIFIMALFVYGWRQHQHWDNVAQNSPKKVVAAIQPSTDQNHKWDQNYREQLLIHLSNLSREAGKMSPWLILWPETAMPFIYNYDAEETGWLLQLREKTGGAALVGITGTSGQWPYEELHNRVILFQDGESGPYYDKLHLVPFGEYVPFGELDIFRWAFVQGLIGAAGTYDPGVPMAPIDLPLNPNDPSSGLVRMGVLICFESIFPRYARQRVLEGANLLVVPTNDGWFGRSRAPEQHLYQAVMRAIETRRPLIRAGNTGITAVVYPSGRIPVASELFDVGVFPLPTPVLTEAQTTLTFYVRYGHLLAPIMAIIAGLLAVLRFFQPRK